MRFINPVETCITDHSRPTVDNNTMDADKIKELEEQIAELKARWPAHSVPPHMWQQLEELEEKLEAARKEPGAAG